MPVAKPVSDGTITVDEIRTEVLELSILGTSPLIMNRLSEKARHELLLPAGRKTAADKAGSLKHDPVDEFRRSPYVFPGDSSPTLLAGLAAWFKSAVLAAALRVPGARKTEIGQLLWVLEERVSIYGIPEIFSCITRSADINKTPDVRTRAIAPQWATTILVEFAVPLLSARSVINLFAAAGKISGVGDWRPEKGKGTYGQFVLVDPDHEGFRKIVETGGRAAQVEAMANPVAYDEETEELLEWFEVEAQARGKINRDAA